MILRRPIKLCAEGINSLQYTRYGSVAQLVEQCPFKALVVGSSPTRPTMLFPPPLSMMIPFSSVSPTAVVIATIVAIAIGFTWYSPLLFGNTWMKLMGIQKPDKMDNKMLSLMGLGMLSSLFNVFMLNVVYIMLDPSTLTELLTHSFILWLTFIVPLQAGEIAWGGKPFLLTVINGAYWLVMLLATAAVLWFMNGLVAIPA